MIFSRYAEDWMRLSGSGLNCRLGFPGQLFQVIKFTSTVVLLTCISKDKFLIFD